MIAMLSQTTISPSHRIGTLPSDGANSSPCRLIALGKAGVSAPVFYSDIDMMIDPAKGSGYRHKDGTPY